MSTRTKKNLPVLQKDEIRAPEAEGRRSFLKLMGASLALAGAGGCTRQPTETIIPYAKQPEQIVPGKPLFYATAMPLGGVGTGVLVESHMGRPIKIEGNPAHPGSLGATHIFAQGSILTLYDPERSKAPLHLGVPMAWPTFVGAMQAMMADKRARQGKGLCLLTGATSSPTLIAEIAKLLEACPLARWYRYEPVGKGMALGGAKMALGEEVEPLYRIRDATILVALDADFLSPTEGHIRYARDFAARRRPPTMALGEPGVASPYLEPEANKALLRLYTIESAPSLTGAKADHRLALRSTDIERFALALAARLGVELAEGASELPPGVDPRFIDAIAEDLKAHRGEGLIIPGAFQTPLVHALAHAMNDALGNAGKTIVYLEPTSPTVPEATAVLADFARAIDAGEVDTLLVLGANPIYSAPAELDLESRFKKIGLRVHLGLYVDETARLCHYHIPEAHYLEAWGDIRAFDGTATIQQPLIRPLYSGRSALDLLVVLSEKPDRSGYDLVREHWKTLLAGDDFEAAWRRALHDGIVPGTEAKIVSHAPRSIAAARPASYPEGLEIVFRPDAHLYDGRFAENAWLEECPRPMTKLSWDNAAWLSPTTAARLELANEDLIDISYQGRVVRAPVFIVPGHADDSITVHLGYGRTMAGAVGTGHGFNAYPLRAVTSPWMVRGVEIRKTGLTYPLATTQEHHTMEDRHLVRVASLSEYLRDPNTIHKMAEAPLHGGSLYPEWEYPSYAWGMAIDTGACIGCNACVVACQAENNIPVVGKEQIMVGREMHWLRVDRYFEPELGGAGTAIHFQPVPCMHCEKAPCEVVCPVVATVHHDEGLNDMVYNRCVGTRYCSNNCPYKVRRFNFFNYNEDLEPAQMLRENPDVTVRGRGVMEKCSYCVQRINYARIEAEKENRRIRDGEIMTACQAVCPTQAIIFGDINDRTSLVSKQKRQPRNYALLAELNTRPRTTYLGTIKNPNPALAGAGGHRAPREGKREGER